MEEVKLTEITQNCHLRTSTPILERRRCAIIKNSKKHSYEKWCNHLEESKPLFKVRGISCPLKDIISGNLIPFTKKKSSDESEDDWYEENPADQRLGCHGDTMKKLLLSVISDHCKSLLKRTMSLVKHEKTKPQRSQSGFN